MYPVAFPTENQLDQYHRLFLILNRSSVHNHYDIIPLRIVNPRHIIEMLIQVMLAYRDLW